MRDIKADCGKIALVAFALAAMLIMIAMDVRL